MPLKVITPEGIEFPIHSPADFEKRLRVRYLSSLDYVDMHVERRLQKRYERSLSKGWITSRQKWMGHYYASGLAGKIPLDLTIAWIGPKVGYGVFTNRALPAKSYIGEYTGILRRRLFFCRRENLYCFDYTIGEGRSSSHVIDAEKAGNHTRFINHSFNPNVGLVSVDYERKVHVLLYAQKQIPAGAQLCYDYGDEYWRKRPPPVSLD